MSEQTHTASDSDAERVHLQMRLTGLTKAVGEMEPGAREFCLAAIDEWLDHMNEQEAEVERLRADLEAAQTLAGTYEEENERLRKQAHKDGTERYVMNERLMMKAKEVERLRGGDWVVDLDERRRAAEAEVERLREELNQRRIAYNTGKEAEVWRLREDLNFLSQRHELDTIEVERQKQNQCLICEYPADHDQRLCVTEVERLRKENLLQKGQLDANPFDHEHLREIEDEVERLRGENDDLRMRVSVRDDIIGQHYLDAPK